MISERVSRKYGVSSYVRIRIFMIQHKVGRGNHKSICDRNLCSIASKPAQNDTLEKLMTLLK